MCAAGALRQLMGQPLHVVRPTPRVDRPGGAGLLLQQQLGVAGDAGRKVGGQSQRLVEGVGVQRLRVPLRCGHRLDAGAGDVVERVLRGQRPTGGLRMRAQRLRFRVLGVELADEFAPQQPAGAQLGDLHEEVHSDAPEEREPRREFVDGKPDVQAGLDVVHTVGQRVGKLQIRCGAGLLDVIAGDRDRVESRHLGAGVAEDVGDDPHRWLRRIDVGVADHELLEDVVLDGPGQLLRRHALLLRGHHVQREDRQYRTVHRHRHRHRRTGRCRRTAGACRGWNRLPPRPFRRRPAPADGRSRNRGGWPGRTLPTAPSVPRPGCGGRRRWSPRRWRSRRTGGWSTAG